MSNHLEIEETFSRSAIHRTMGAAIGTVLALLAAATALIIAAVNPALNGRVIAAAAGTGIGVIALAVIIATALIRRLRLPNNNDAWILW